MHIIVRYTHVGRERGRERKYTSWIYQRYCVCVCTIRRTIVKINMFLYACLLVLGKHHVNTNNFFCHEWINCTATLHINIDWFRWFFVFAFARRLSMLIYLLFCWYLNIKEIPSCFRFTHVHTETLVWFGFSSTAMSLIYSCCCCCCYWLLIAQQKSLYPT